MGITEEQRKQRRHHIGGSDVPRLYDGHAHEVWLSKVYETEDHTTEAMDLGNRLEDVVLDWAEEQLGTKLARNMSVQVKNSPLSPNVDAITENGSVLDGVPVEAKTSGIRGPIWGDWGDEGTDEVPESVLLQCHAHMIALGAPICHVPALLGGRGFVMFQVKRSEALCDMILRDVRQFWDDHVVAKVPPGDEWDIEAAGRSLDVLKRIVRVPNKVLGPKTIDMKLITTWETTKAFVRMAENMRDAYLGQIVTHLGDAEAAELSDGRYFTYMKQTRKAHAVKEATFPVARIKKSLPQLEAE